MRQILAAIWVLLVAAHPAAAAEATMKLASDAFTEGRSIPRDHTCDGRDRSPPLHWQGAPAGTRAFAIVVDDPDAPVGNWNHWLLYDLPANATALPEGIDKIPQLTAGGRQGKTSFGKVGYYGPCPPPGNPHRYYFKLYALSAPLDLEPGATREQVLGALKDKTVAKADLMARYGR